MKHSSVFFFLVALVMSSQVQARTEAEVKSDMVKAAKTAVNEYEQTGMAGLIDKTENCYKNVRLNQFYCVYIDLASRHIDQVMVEGSAKQGMAFPKNEFFDDKLFGARIAKVFNKANMNMETSNDYLRSATPAINKLVENIMFHKR